MYSRLSTKQLFGGHQRVAYIEKLLPSEGYDISEVQTGPEKPLFVTRDRLHQSILYGESTVHPHVKALSSAAKLLLC